METTEYKPDPKMHDMYDAVVMSLSAIMLMSSHPYNYWKGLGTIICSPKTSDEDKKMWRESSEQCQRVMRKTCELLDEVMNYIGDCNNAQDAADEYGMTDAAFEAMNRALGRSEEQPCLSDITEGGAA